MTRLREILEAYWECLPERLAFYRAHLLAFAAFALGLLEVVDPYALQYFLPERYSGYLFIGVSVAIFLLRSLLAGRHEPEPMSTEDTREANEE